MLRGILYKLEADIWSRHSSLPQAALCSIIGLKSAKLG